MALVYILIGIVIGVVGSLFLDVDALSNLFAKKEETFDDKEEHNEEHHKH
jgi:hypothetical protein